MINFIKDLRLLYRKYKQEKLQRKQEIDDCKLLSFLEKNLFKNSYYFKHRYRIKFFKYCFIIEIYKEIKIKSNCK